MEIVESGKQKERVEMGTIGLCLVVLTVQGKYEEGGAEIGRLQWCSGLSCESDLVRKNVSGFDALSGVVVGRRGIELPGFYGVDEHSQREQHFFESRHMLLCAVLVFNSQEEDLYEKEAGFRAADVEG